MDATFMTALHIHHVRHLKDIYIPLSTKERKSLVLTGKNGSGKSNVLEALNHFLEYVVSDSFHSEAECKLKLLRMHSRLEINKEGWTQRKGSKNIKKAIEMWEKWSRYWTDGAVVRCSSYLELRSKYQKGEYIIAYYGDHREIKVEISKNIEKVDLKEVYALTERPRQQLVKYLVNLKTTQAFAQTSGDWNRAKEIQDWFDRFEVVLRTIYGDESLKLQFDIETFQFTIQQDNRESFDFNSMSMGYAAVFDIVGDLMMRMEKRRRYDVEGLVLIDEIESHLHVELQKNIVPILMNLFPNIQFVFTTHSPFVLNSTPNAVVYDLDKGILVKEGLTNLPYEGVVEGYFGADLLSQELREKFNEYRTLAQKPDLTDADYARLAELELYLDAVPAYLALNFSSLYSQLKLELDNRADGQKREGQASSTGQQRPEMSHGHGEEVSLPVVCREDRWVIEDNTMIRRPQDNIQDDESDNCTVCEDNKDSEENEHSRQKLELNHWG